MTKLRFFAFWGFPKMVWKLKLEGTAKRWLPPCEARPIQNHLSRQNLVTSHSKRILSLCVLNLFWCHASHINININRIFVKYIISRRGLTQGGKMFEISNFFQCSNGYISTTVRDNQSKPAASRPYWSKLHFKAILRRFKLIRYDNNLK